MPYDAFRAGDVVLGPDPFHDNDPMLIRGGRRPWVVINSRAYPWHGSNYVCCALTSNPAAIAACVNLQPFDWLKGAPRRPSAVDASTIMTLKHDWIGGYVGRLASTKLDEIRMTVRSFL